MNQNTISFIKAYAYLFNDLRAILNTQGYPITDDRIKSFNAEFDRLNGIVEAIKNEQDKDGARRMIWGWVWPLPTFFRITKDEKENLTKRIYWRQRSSLTQDAAKIIANNFIELLNRVNDITKQIVTASRMNSRYKIFLPDDNR